MLTHPISKTDSDFKTLGRALAFLSAFLCAGCGGTSTNPAPQKDEPPSQFERPAGLYQGTQFWVLPVDVDPTKADDPVFIPTEEFTKLGRELRATWRSGAISLEMTRDLWRDRLMKDADRVFAFRPAPRSGMSALRRVNFRVYALVYEEVRAAEKWVKVPRFNSFRREFEFDAASGVWFTPIAAFRQDGVQLASPGLHLVSTCGLEIELHGAGGATGTARVEFGCG